MARTSHLPNPGPVVAWVTLRLVTKESHKVLEAGPPRLSLLSGREISPTDSEPTVAVFRSRPRPLRDLASGDLGKRIVASMQPIAFQELGESR